MNLHIKINIPAVVLCLLLLVPFATWTSAQTTKPITTTTTKPVTTTTTKPVTTTTSGPPCDCGTITYARIVNGSEAGDGEIPWQARMMYALMEGMNYYCGAVVISSQYLLTAAHCFDDKWKFRTRVAFGFTDIYEEFPTFMIRSWLAHPDYQKDRQDADIGLIRLFTTIQFTPWVKPICLPPRGTNLPFLGKEVTVSGWGDTEYKGNGSELLLETQMDIIKGEVCVEKLKQYKFNPETMLCVYRLYHDSCKGDSGGPATLEARDDVHFLVGIIAFGFRCAVPGVPSALTKVTHYLEWIHKNTCSPICTKPMHL